MMRIRKQLEYVEKYFREFINHRRRGESIYAVERLAQLVAQSLLDLGALIAISTDSEKPETYRGIAEYLSRTLGLTDDLKSFLEGLAGFRNILVHGYAEINRKLEEEAFDDIEKHLPTILNKLSEYISSLKVDPHTNAVAELRKLEQVFKEHGVKLAFLFGSRARRGRGRDYDIAVVVNLRNALELGRLVVDIARALNIREDQVDLVHLDTASAHVVYTIILEGKQIYGDEEEALDYLYKKYLEILDAWSTIRTSRLPPP